MNKCRSGTESSPLINALAATLSDGWCLSRGLGLLFATEGVDHFGVAELVFIGPQEVGQCAVVCCTRAGPPRVGSRLRLLMTSWCGPWV